MCARVYIKCIQGILIQYQLLRRLSVRVPNALKWHATTVLRAAMEISVYHVTSPIAEAGLSSFVFHNHFLKYTQWKEKIYQKEKKVLRHLKCTVCITIFGGRIDTE